MTNGALSLKLRHCRFLFYIKVRNKACSEDNMSCNVLMPKPCLGRQNIDIYMGHCQAFVNLHRHKSVASPTSRTRPNTVFFASKPFSQQGPRIAADFSDRVWPAPESHDSLLWT